MPVFLLVHGAQHGAWCWDKTLERLRALGHEAHAIDLPGHGDDDTPRAEIRLACDRAVVIFNGRVVDVIDARDADEATLMRAAYGLTEKAPA